jgi:hypothetical protein
MADEEEYDETEEQPSDQRSNSDWATLRRTASKAKKAEAEALQAKRELAFLRAGVDLDDPRSTYFVKGYDGEVNVDAIRSAALEAGFIQQREQPPSSDATSAQRIRAAAAGGVPSAGGGLDGISARMDDAYRQGGNEALVAQLQNEGFPITYE